jgi:hypothetical protein
MTKLAYIFKLASLGQWVALKAHDLEDARSTPGSILGRVFFFFNFFCFCFLTVCIRHSRNYLILSRERSSTGSNDCFDIVVIVVVVVVGIFIL